MSTNKRLLSFLEAPFQKLNASCEKCKSQDVFIRDTQTNDMLTWDTNGMLISKIQIRLQILFLILQCGKWWRQHCYFGLKQGALTVEKCQVLVDSIGVESEW